MKVKELVLKVASLVTAVLAFVGLAFKYLYQSTTVANVTRGDHVSLKDANEMLDTMSKLDKPYRPDYYGWLKAGKVFMIIALVVVAVLAVITIVQFFYNHKILSLVKMVVAGVAIALAVVFFVCILVGCLKVESGVPGVTASMVPNVAVYFVTLFCVASGVTALLDRKTK